MNPRERLLTTLRGGAADRVPLVLEKFHYPDRALTGLPEYPDEAAREADVKARRELVDRVFDETHFFFDCGGGGNRYLMTPPQRIRTVAEHASNGEITRTSEVDTPKGPLTAVVGSNPATQTSWAVKYPVESLEDIEKIRSVPWELPPGLAPPDLSRLPPAFERRGIIRAGVSSPFVCVGGMMSYQRFLELCATELNLVEELTQMCLDRIMSTLDVVLADRNVEYLWMGGSEWLTPPMGSPALYERLVHRYEKPIIERAHAAGALVHVHCHGNVRDTMEMVIERGGDFLEPMEPPPDGDITMAEAKAVADGRITLGGNIEARVIENESEAAVEAAVHAAFEGGRQRMVLQTTAGPLSALTPRTLRNYHRMIDLWEELSPLAQESSRSSASEPPR